MGGKKNSCRDMSKYLYADGRPHEKQNKKKKKEKEKNIKRQKKVHVAEMLHMADLFNLKLENEDVESGWLGGKPGVCVWKGTEWIKMLGDINKKKN